MAASSFGASSLKPCNLRLNPRIELANLHQNGLRLSNSQRFDGLAISHRSGKASNGCLCLPVKNDVQSGTDLEDCSEVEVSSESTSQFNPSATDVESLLTEICDTTSIAEVDLKLGGFRLHVLRDLTGPSTSSPPPVSAPIVSATVEAPPEQNGSASSLSLAITKAEPNSVGIQTILDTAADEGLAIIQSPRVGFFRRSRTIKGKRAPPPCKEKQIVKEGQVVCYIEQLGGELPIESDVAGEVIKILREDGEPVGYGDALIAVLPSFPGIKKL
uniref:biotin carboxyl carrier protein of acetyl-CoA carboxylase-like n=1 Tax=Erigeron canadensis TaxID=72917 RepID=UPI001CB9672D|nr:biotin carboxyl carrier protein of acetyl-CoA carboxylase-like [Erigeron canadensis]